MGYMGFGCMAPTSKGCCLSIGELCCCAGTCKSATCCDDDGCVASTSKCCCCLAHGEVPPSNTPGVGCGPAMFCAKWNEDSTNPYEQEEMLPLDEPRNGHVLRRWLDRTHDQVVLLCYRCILPCRENAGLRLLQLYDVLQELARDDVER